MIEITAGDDITIPVTLKKNGATFAIDSAATINAAIVDVDVQNLLSSVVTVNKSAAGTDLANSLIQVSFTSAQTAGVRPGNAKIEIQVDDSGKTTWHLDCIFKRGIIP